MAQSVVTDSGTIFIPGGYSTVKVQKSAGGLSTTGVLMLVGESDAGPDFSLETDLAANTFGPDELTSVVAKYKTGHLVDAFRAAVAAASDEEITGSFSRCILVKTNPSIAASGTVAKFDSSTYGTVKDRSYGKLGNLISYQVTANQAEVVPSTGPFLFLPPIASTNISVRVNGGAAQALTLSAAQSPTSFASAMDGLTGVDSTGGVDRGLIGSATGTLALAVVSGNNVTFTRSVAWTALPVIGDVVYMSSSSVLASSNLSNAGSYVVTAVTSTTVSATKLLDAQGSPAQLSTPIAKSAINIVSTSADLQAFSPVTVSLVASTNPIDGMGKSLEIAELTSGTGILSTLCYSYDGVNGAVKSTWMSKSGTPYIITSSAEYIATLTAARQLDAVTEDMTAGGSPVLSIGYAGTTASAVVTATTMTLTVVGGSGSSPAAISLKDFKTISDLAAYINSLTGFTAAAASNTLGAQLSTTLDRGTYTFASTFGGTPGRIKQDAYKFFTKVNNDSVLVKMAAQASAGLPAPAASVAFLSGGVKGATTDAVYAAAMEALKLVRGNFVVPLFSRDASDDIADDLTDTSSTYTIAGINSYTKAHVLQMSTLKARRNRQGFLSFRGTFTNAKAASSGNGHFRFCMPFQDAKDVGANGVEQFQSWMMAVKAAGMQAAAFYRPIFRKGINISGAVQAAGDFNDQDDSKTEDALQAGLMPVRRAETGEFYFVSDQTCYGKDENFVYNSVQAVYIGDVIALSTAQRMEKAFVGQSLADISASAALGALENIMEDFRRLKLISASDDAPKGYLNPKVSIKGGTMSVAIEVKLAGALYFVVIGFEISQVQQSA